MHLTLNDEAKSMHFRQGMNRQIKEKLIGQDTTGKSFHQFVRHCLSIDNDIRAFEQEQGSRSSGNWKGKNVANNSRRRYQGDNNGYTQRSRTNANHHFRSTNTPRYDDGTTPMDLDATGQHKRLSEEERERLSASKSCFKCKKPGHFARNCREKAEPSTRNNYNNNGNRRNNDSSKKKYGQDRTIAATYYYNGYEQPLNTSLTNPYLTTPVFLPAPPIESQQGSPDQEQQLDSAEEEVVATNDGPAPTTTGSGSATSPPHTGIGSPAGGSERAGTPSFPSSIDTDTERLILGENQTILHQQAFDVIGIHVTGIQAVLETMSTTVGTKRPSDSLESPAKHLRTNISPDFVIAEGEDAWNTTGPTTISEEDPAFREYWPLSEPSPAEARWIARNPLTMEMINGYFRRDTTGRLWETFEYPVYTNRDGRKVYQIDHRMIQLQGTEKCDSEYCCYWGRRVDLGISRWTFERKCARSCNNFTCKVCHVTASPTHSSLFHDTCGNCRDQDERNKVARRMAHEGKISSNPDIQRAIEREVKKVFGRQKVLQVRHEWNQKYGSYEDGEISDYNEDDAVSNVDSESEEDRPLLGTDSDPWATGGNVRQEVRTFDDIYGQENNPLRDPFFTTHRWLAPPTPKN